MKEEKNIYVGNRYVPKIMGEWNKQESYEGLSIVSNEGNSFTSKKRVPVGIALSNEEYWVSTGNYNIQVENYRKEVKLQGDSLASFKEITETDFLETRKEIDLLNRSNGTVSILEYEQLKTLTTSGVHDWKNAIQTALDSGAKKVTFPDGEFYSSTIEIPLTLSELEGVGTNGTKLIHLGSGALIQKKSTINRIRDFSIKGLYLEGNGLVGESCGIDLTGFSYGSLMNIRVRLFALDGIFAKGDITPENKQVSNITFVNVTSNNNKRHGLKLEGANRIENTALNFVGCEISGNSVDGVHIDTSEKVIFTGGTIQGNGGYDIYDNGRLNSYNDCWVENARFKTVLLDSLSESISFNRPKTSYPIWNFLIDKGNSNIIIPDKQNGLLNPKIINKNTLLENLKENNVPDGYTLNGEPTVQQLSDDRLINKKFLRFTVTENFQGYVINLPYNPLFLQDKWVTVKIKYKVDNGNGITHRIHSRFDTTPNLLNGTFVSEILESTNNKYITRLFDIKFPSVITSETTTNIVHYLGYSNAVGHSTLIDIAEIEVLL